jgi:Polymer-forming cytoskeletal
MRTSARVAAFLFVVAVVALSVTPAFAASKDEERNNEIVITGTVDVRSGDAVDRVLIFDGDVRIDGRVRNWVFAFNGDVVVNGRVNGDVTALNGRVVVSESGSVAGDVVSSDRPAIAKRSSVHGNVDRARRRFALGRLGAIGRIVLWIAATVSSFLLGGALLLVSPRGADAVARAGRNAIGPAIGLGFAVAIGVPVVGVLLSVTVIGLPLGLATLFALALMYGLGYVSGCYFVGRLILKEPRNRLLAFLVGWGILRVVAIVPVLGALTMAAATVYGLGCLTVAVFRARRGRATDEPPTDDQPAIATL